MDVDEEEESDSQQSWPSWRKTTNSITNQHPNVARALKKAFAAKKAVDEEEESDSQQSWPSWRKTINSITNQHPNVARALKKAFAAKKAKAPAAPKPALKGGR